MGFQTDYDRKRGIAGLTTQHDKLETLAELDKEPVIEAEKDPEGPFFKHIKKERDFRKADGAKGKQIESVDAFEGKDVEAVDAVGTHLHTSRFAARDPIAAAYLQQREVNPTVAKVLAGDRVDSEEAHHLTAKGLASKKEIADWALAPPLRATFLRNVLKDPGAVLGLVVISPWLLKWLGVLTGTFAAATIVGSIGVSLEGGRVIEQETAPFSTKDEKGINRFEQKHVENELIRLFDWVADEAVPTDPAELRATLETDVSLFDALLDLRKKALGSSEQSPPPDEVAQPFHQFKTQVASLLASDQTGDITSAYAKIRTEFLQSIDPEALVDESSGILPKADIEDETYRRGVNALISAQIETLCQATNESLYSLVQDLEKEVNIEQHMETRDARKLSPSQVTALQVAANDTPPLHELYSVARLVYSGAVELSDIWPEISHDLLPDEQVLHAQDLVKDLAELNKNLSKSSSAAEWTAKVLPKVGIVLGLSSVFLLESIVGSPGFLTYGLGIGAPLLGGYGGARLDMWAHDQTLLHGANLGQPAEVFLHGKLLRRFANAGGLAEKEPDELREQLIVEADTIDVMRTAHTHEVEKEAEHGVPQPEGAQQLPEGHVVAEPTPPDQQQFIHDLIHGVTPSKVFTLRDFSERLKELGSKTGATKEETVAGLRQAWMELFTSPIQTLYRNDLMDELQVPEEPPLFRYLAAKRAFMDTYVARLSEQLQQGQPLINDDPDLKQAADIVKHARLALAESERQGYKRFLSAVPAVGPLMPMFESKGRSDKMDPIDGFTDWILDNPQAAAEPLRLLSDRPDKLKVVEPPKDPEMLPLRIELLDKQVRWDLAHVNRFTDERLDEIPQEYVEALLRNVLPTAFGFDRPPSVKVTVTDAAQVEGGLQLKCDLKSKRTQNKPGKMEITLSSFAEVDLNSVRLDLGEDVLGHLAEEYLQRYLGLDGREVKGLKLRTRPSERSSYASGDFLIHTKSHGPHVVTMKSDGTLEQIKSLT